MVEWNSEKLGSLWRSKGFDKWELIGISRIKDIWGKTSIHSFDTLKKQFSLADAEYFRYLQIRHALLTHIPRDTTPLEASPLEGRVLDGHLPIKATSLIYRKLINIMEDSLQSLKNKWNNDSLVLDNEDWQEAISSPREVEIQARLRLVQLKILHRVYVTGPALVRMGHLESGECRRGCRELGTFFHILWHCHYIQTYWRDIHCTMQTVLGINLQPEARRCILNVWEPTDLNTHTTQWATLAFMLAKRNIAQLWGASQPPQIEKWKEDLDWCMFREKSVYIARGCPGKWIKIWEAWNNYRGGICHPPDYQIDTDTYYPLI